MIGTSIAHYRITAKLGEGGMGAVYRAADDRLNREVAVKVLPETFARDPDRLARFQREAQVLAALNHTNIAQIYGLETQDNRQALILELVEGETLEDRIRRAPISVEEVRKLSLQIAEALEVAHEKGIIHRDLKPANIKITPAGVVKVLDFGLAKALTPEVSEPDLGQSPTMTAAATQIGLIMGTASYMSPEQARGKPVDRRADIWAFGCVLYEMLVGHKPFKGADVSEVLAHIITQEPDLDPLPAGLPSLMEDVIRRCLRKDLRMRLPDIGAARIALQEAGDAPKREESEPGAIQKPKSRWPLALVAAAGLVLGLALGWGFMNGRPSSVTAPNATHFELVLDPPPAHWAMALAADGGSVVYSGRKEGERQLYLRDLHGFTSRPLPGTKGGHWPFYSPDGQEIGFFSAGRLKTIHLQGGLPESVCGVAGEIYGAIWTPEDEIIYSSNSISVPHRVSARGGKPAPLEVDGLEDNATLIMPRLLPGGRAILATHEAPSLDGPQIVVVNLQDGTWKSVARGYDAQYVEPATLLFVQRDRVMTAGFNPQTWEVSGAERESGLEEPAISRQSFSTRFYAASASNGTLLYPAGRFGQASEVHWLNRDGETEETGFSGLAPQLDSTGRRALVLDMTSNVWLLDFAENSNTQLTFKRTSAYAMWSRDDRQIIFNDRRSGSWAPYTLAADGTGEVKRILEDDLSRELPSPISTSTHPDGSLMVYGVHPETNRDIWLLHKEGKPEPVLQTGANERVGVISPDGKLFAYVTDEVGGVDQVYVRQLPDTGRRWPASQDGGLSPVWSRDGSELFFRSRDTLMGVTLSREGPLRMGEPVALFTSHRLDLDRWGNKTFDSAPDGRLLISMREPSDVRVRIVLSSTGRSSQVSE